jgi:hypothetical protein
MKKTILSAFTVLSFSLGMQAQPPKTEDVQKSINDALTALKAKNYKETNLSLQQALSDLNLLQGSELLTALPETILTYKADKSSDNVSNAGAAFGAGTVIERNYKGSDENKNFRVKFISNSPMMATLNMYLSNPMYANAGEGQSVVKIGTRRGMLKFNNGSGELQMSLGQSLLTLEFNEIPAKADVTAFAEKLDLDKVAKLLGE